jgi:hypothetical protein
MGDFLNAAGLPRTSGLRAARAVCRDQGISDTTLWRWRRLGWIKTVNISGKVYVDMASLDDFQRRAVGGEFSKPVAGAAGQSAAARAEQEATK